MNTLDDHTIVVTGASRGIGEATARLLACEGARVGLMARSTDRIATLANEIVSAGGVAVAVGCDVGSDRSVEAAFDRVRSEFGHLTGLVNNAGVVAPIGRLGDTDPQAWADNISINLAGVYRATRAALPDLLAARRGVVVNVSSGAAGTAIEGWSAYCAAKAGAMMLTQSLDLEYGPAGLSVYGLRPGMVDTDMQGEIRASGINPVSQIAREKLLPVSVPAAAIAWLVRAVPAAWRGRDLDVREEEFQRAASLDRVLSR